MRIESADHYRHYSTGGLRHKRARVSRRAQLMPGCVVERGARVLEGAYVGPGAWVGPGAYVGRDAFVGGGAFVGREASLHMGASVSHGATVGKRALVGARAWLAPGATLLSGRSAAPSERVVVTPQSERCGRNIRQRTWAYAAKRKRVAECRAREAEGLESAGRREEAARHGDRVRTDARVRDGVTRAYDVGTRK